MFGRWSGRAIVELLFSSSRCCWLFLKTGQQLKLASSNWKAQTGKLISPLWPMTNRLAQMQLKHSFAHN